MTVIDEIAGRSFVRIEYVAFPLCGSKHDPRAITTRFGQVAMVANCEACDLGYQTPRPTLEASIAYMDWRWSSEDAYVRDNDGKRKTSAKQISIVRDQVGDKKVRVLDFGAGSGAFVKAAIDAGHDAVGIEHSQGAIDRALEDYGVTILKEVPAGETFDVVTMWDVIEHLRDPISVLTMVKNLLKPGGILIIETGNYEFWERHSLGDKWRLYLLDHHFYFTPKSLAETISRANFKETSLLRVSPKKPRLKIGRPISSWRNFKIATAAKRKYPDQYDIPLLYAVARK
ncbi:class I SAM-dependent methyltransferase [Agrobacterium rosae]|uniref:class I SAM-dependent methyltransferase n=1 Tax=Agrobacterium rosae TaxID=1972867 RepID=UPI003B9E8666